MTVIKHSDFYLFLNRSTNLQNLFQYIKEKNKFYFIFYYLLLVYLQKKFVFSSLNKLIRTRVRLPPSPQGGMVDKCFTIFCVVDLGTYNI